VRPLPILKEYDGILIVVDRFSKNGMIYSHNNEHSIKRSGQEPIRTCLQGYGDPSEDYKLLRAIIHIKLYERTL